jgi:hypothetical protein
VAARGRVRPGVGKAPLARAVGIAGHHHGSLADADLPLGNGVAVWFETDDFDAIVRRSRDAGAEVVTDVHMNPNARHRELWLRDPDGYLGVFAEAT